MDLYEYEFTTGRKRATGRWWKRRKLGTYLGPLSLYQPRLIRVLKEQGWLNS